MFKNLRVVEIVFGVLIRKKKDVGSAVKDQLLRAIDLLTNYRCALVITVLLAALTTPPLYIISKLYFLFIIIVFLFIFVVFLLLLTPFSFLNVTSR